MLRPLVPTALFVLGGATAITALHFEPRSRPLFLLPAMLFTICSILSIPKESISWIPQAFSFCQGITAFYQLLFLPLLLCSRNGPTDDISANPENNPKALSTFDWRSIARAYRRWNNPRLLALDESAPPPHGIPQRTLATAVAFSLRRGLKVALLHLINTKMVQPMFDHVMSGAMLVDFAPESEPIIRRLLFASPTNTLDSKQFAVRVLISFHWIWHDFLSLETCHGALAILFVAILGVDNIGDWPPLYGNLLDAWSVKRFWGRYWHRLMTTTYSRYACMFSRTICRSSPRSSTDKILVAFGIFAISGLGHALINWRHGEVALARDPMFFLANFVVVAFEVYISRIAKRCLTKSTYESCAGGWQLRMLGYIWVGFWLLWIVPRWEFPRIKNGWLQAIA